MTKITPEHLARQAIVYIRQSTADQVINNLESQRRQYGLAERVRQLGWADVTVIDDDLGRSGSGIARPGFEKLLAAICEGRVGAVVSVEASRLARNGRDWHTLLEFCGLVGSLIIDEDGTYDPRHPNDRLLLGMKGTMSEMELSIFRQRSQEALKQKARRGELFMTVAIGYLRTAHDRIEKDPDRRIQEAIGLIFGKFTELQTVRQVHLWLRQEKITLPAVVPGAEGRRVEWKLPVYNTIYHILTNPIYGGAYAFGRTASRVTIEAGRKRIVRGFRRARSDWDVLINDHHEGYIPWLEFERNQRLVSDNANGKSFMSRGAIRRGEALLAGLFRCGHCGRKLHVAYSGADQQRLRALGADLEQAWNSPGATPPTRKRIIRTLINEIVVRVGETMLDLVVHWHGGDHTALTVKKNRAGQHRWSAAADVIDLVRVLARQMPDKAIAAVLNRAGKSTGKGNSWTRGRVCSLRNQQAIEPYKDGERAERGEVTLDEAATTLSVSPSTIRRLIADGALPALQLCKGAPWVIRSCDLDQPNVRNAAEARRLRRPPSGNPSQKELEL